MKKVRGKIVLIDDEKFEKELLEKGLKKMNWNVRVEHINNPDVAYKYLKETTDEIFLIICDMQMPQTTGLQLKRAIESDRVFRHKAIPFILCSSSATIEEWKYVYEYSVQGFFEKPKDINAMVDLIDNILRYWSKALRPVI